MNIRVYNTLKNRMLRKEAKRDHALVNKLISAFQTFNQSRKASSAVKNTLGTVADYLGAGDVKAASQLLSRLDNGADGMRIVSRGGEYFIVPKNFKSGGRYLTPAELSDITNHGGVSRARKLMNSRRAALATALKNADISPLEFNRWTLNRTGGVNLTEDPNKLVDAFLADYKLADAKNVPVPPSTSTGRIVSPSRAQLLLNTLPDSFWRARKAVSDAAAGAGRFLTKERGPQWWIDMKKNYPKWYNAHRAAIAMSPATGAAIASLTDSDVQRGTQPPPSNGPDSINTNNTVLPDEPENYGMHADDIDHYTGNEDPHIHGPRTVLPQQRVQATTPRSSEDNSNTTMEVPEGTQPASKVTASGAGNSVAGSSERTTNNRNNNNGSIFSDPKTWWKVGGAATGAVALPWLVSSLLSGSDEDGKGSGGFLNTLLTLAAIGGGAYGGWKLGDYMGSRFKA